VPTQPGGELTPTARSILGHLSLQERSGYEIRQATKRNLAWKVSDGQLYPQLAKLRAAGLIEPAGPADRVHARQRWRLTPSGEQALAAWVLSETEHLHVRDENLTKLMFADQFGPEAMLALLRRRQAEFTELRQRLLAINPGSGRQPSDEGAGRLGPGLAHRYGLDFAALNIDWCERAIAAVTRQQQPDS
jgi:DNA-binding PadR family transcriptional regulator